jgi:transposase
MIAAGAELKIYIATRPIDFRCGHDGLATKVQEMLGLDPFDGSAFVFRSKRADRIKILVWDRTGLVLVHKRLEGCKSQPRSFRLATEAESRNASAL